MPIFTAKIRHLEFTFSPFTTSQMEQIGTLMLNAKKARISRAVNSQDLPAKPLVNRYAKEKIKRGRAPIRDWMWRGLTMGSFRVKRVDEEKVVIGFVNAESDKIVTMQRRKEEMLSDSPRDTAALHAVTKAIMQQSTNVRLVRAGYEQVSAWSRLA